MSAVGSLGAGAPDMPVVRKLRLGPLQGREEQANANHTHSTTTNQIAVRDMLLLKGALFVRRVFARWFREFGTNARLDCLPEQSGLCYCLNCLGAST